MLKEVAANYYLKEGCNCAESLLYAANLYYKLGLSEESLKLIGAFGGGMGCKTTCGALSGAIAAISAKYQTGKAHETPQVKEISGGFVKCFEEKLGSTLCSVLEPQNKQPEVRCLRTVELAAEALENYLKELEAKKSAALEEALSPEEIKRLKGMGFLQHKGTRLFNARVITRNGKVTAQEMKKVAEASEKFAGGEVVMTTRMTMEVKGIPYEQIDAFLAFLAEAGLETGGTGAKVRPVVSCKGTTCQYGLYDTYALSQTIHERFYKGYRAVDLPHKFKIAVGGCPNNCVKPSLNDIGIMGQRLMNFDPEICKGCKKCAIEKTCPVQAAKVIDGKLSVGTDCLHCGRCLEKCPFHAVTPGESGYRIFIGGRWGKKTAVGQPLDRIFTSEEEVLQVIEKAIVLFRDEGIKGERFADMINRLGFETVQEKLLSSVTF